MTTYPMRTRVRKPFRLADIQADLFTWAEARAASAYLPETFAERALMKRLHMPLHMIRVYAENAGIGGRQ